MMKIVDVCNAILTFPGELLVTNRQND